MKYRLYLSAVNRPDLLRQAVQSAAACWEHTTVIDNSWEHMLRREKWMPSPVSVYEPPVHLSFSQIMNHLQQEAEEAGLDAFLFMHNDAEAYPGTLEALLGQMENWKEAGIPWAIALTHYDYLIAFHAKAARAVGPWDTTLPAYFADCDYYYRVGLSGFRTMRTGLGVTHHGSSTIYSDRRLKLQNDATFPLYEQYYLTKWGGTPGEERYLVPFTSKPDAGHEKWTK
jgi:hypothetical protein